MQERKEELQLSEEAGPLSAAKTGRRLDMKRVISHITRASLGKRGGAAEKELRVRSGKQRLWLED